NFVLGRSISLYGVFRKQWWAALFVQPGQPAIGHLMQFQGVAGGEWVASTKGAGPDCCIRH
ncbi:MAG TPA: hypothetical protein VF524_13835, partial [Polyangia bacterium]